MLGERRLIWAMFTEAAEGFAFRLSLAAQFEMLIKAAVAAGHLPEQDAGLAARGLLGCVLEGLMGPLAPDAAAPEAQKGAAQTLALFALRALGVVDARARGLVVQAG
jgi:hypothetical protein